MPHTFIQNIFIIDVNYSNNIFTWAFLLCYSWSYWNYRIDGKVIRFHRLIYLKRSQQKGPQRRSRPSFAVAKSKRTDKSAYDTIQMQRFRRDLLPKQQVINRSRRSE